MSLTMTKTNSLLYASHAMSRWSDRMWAFAMGLFLIHLSPRSFTLTASYNLVVMSFKMCFSGSVGRVADERPRLETMRTALVVQNFSVACAAVVVAAGFRLDVPNRRDEAVFAAFAVLLTALGVVEALAGAATRTIVERDWIVVLASSSSNDENDPDASLSDMNATMRTIDLLCNTFAPLLAGLLMAFDVFWAAVAIAAWNVASFAVEYGLLMRVYERVPGLAAPKTFRDAPSSDAGDGGRRDACDNLRVYFSQEVALVGVCLSLLFLTVLGFSPVTVGYLRLNNVSDLAVAVVTSVGSVFGVLGSVNYAFLAKRFGVPFAGAIGAATLACGYGLCLASLRFERDDDGDRASTTTTTNADDPLAVSGPVPAHVVVLLIGMVSKRFGLWTFDLAASQLFQSTVPERQRNTVGGVQLSLNSLFTVAYHLLTIRFSDPKDFDVLIVVSCVSCIGSSLTYLGWFVATTKKRESLEISGQREARNVVDKEAYEPIGE